ncbi:MAG: hypothetical protein GQ582_00650 [Methyloprofundus sp.]|nr:hypothetical protein [Methyloprofundus sp.]
MSNEVYKLLSTLKKEHQNIDAAALALVITELTPAIIDLSELLEKIFISFAKGAKVGKVNIRILFYLAFLHVELAKRLASQHDKVLHANYAMQLIGLLTKNCALSYERLPEGLYACASECYHLAMLEGILKDSVQDPLEKFQTLDTFSLALKRWLLFYVMNPYQFNQQDIISLFDFCSENSALLHIIESMTPDLVGEQVFCWDYKQEGSYQPIFLTQKEFIDDSVLFTTNALVNFDTKQELRIESPDLLMAILSQFKLLLDSSRFSEFEAYIFVSGFSSIVSFFNKHTYQGRIVRLNSPTPKTLNFSSVMNVSDHRSLEEEKEMVSAADIWDHKKEERLKQGLVFGVMKLVNVDLMSFYVAESMSIELSAADLFVCYAEDLSIELGIVRRVRGSGKGAIQKSVVELCSGELTLLKQVDNETGGVALLLKQESSYEVFLKPGQYRVETRLVFDQVQITLERLVEISENFTRYVVSVKRKRPKVVEEAGDV